MGCGYSKKSSEQPAAPRTAPEKHPRRVPPTNIGAAGAPVKTGVSKERPGRGLVLDETVIGATRPRPIALCVIRENDGEADVESETHQINELTEPSARESSEPTFWGIAAAETSTGIGNVESETSDQEIATVLSLTPGAEAVTIAVLLLATGARHTVQVNRTHTVGEIRRHVLTMMPPGTASVELTVRDRPPRVLADDRATVEGAALANVVVTAKTQKHVGTA